MASGVASYNSVVMKVLKKAMPRSLPHNPQQSSVMGLPVHLQPDYVDWLLSQLQQQKGVHIVTLNAEMAMQAEQDEAVWQYAVVHQLVIVSKDADFHQKSFLYGHPPKVIWIRLGNCSTSQIETLLRMHLANLVIFNDDPTAALLTLG